MNFKKHILLVLVTLFLGVTGFAGEKVFLGEEREVVNNVGNAYSDNDKERTKLVVHSSKDKSGGYTTLWTEGYVRPYKKTLGIWYYAKRTCTAHIKYEAAYEKSGTTHSINRDVILGPDLTYKLSSRKNEPAFYGDLTFAYISFIDSWGDTPSTDFAVINCY